MIKEKYENIVLVILVILLSIFVFFLGLCEPKANTIGHISTSITLACGGGCIDTNSSILIPEQSIIYGSALIYPTSQYPDLVNGIGVYDPNTNNEYMCTIGSLTLYNDTNREIELVSFECNVPKNNGPYASQLIYHKGTNGATTGVTTSGNVNVVPISSIGGSGGGTQIDYTNNFSDLYWTLQDIKTRDNTFYNDVYVLISDKLDAILAALQSNQTTINNIQNNTSNINNSINDSSIDSSGASSSASTWNGKNASNGTITNLLTLPITLLQAIVNGLQTSCSSFSLGSLFGTNITLPCINVGNLIGSGLWTTIDILFSGFMILAIAKKLIKIFNDFTNLKSNQMDELYGGGNK